MAEQQFGTGSAAQGRNEHVTQYVSGIPRQRARCTVQFVYKGVPAGERRVSSIAGQCVSSIGAQPVCSIEARHADPIPSWFALQ